MSKESSVRTLRLGCVGADVTALQQKLAGMGFSPGNTDGVFGGGTEAAVIAFQHSQGLLADGIVGPRTARSLGLEDAPPLPDVLDLVTPDVVCRMFPSTPVRNIQQHLPFIRDALAARKLTDKPMVLMALATIRAETESFLPVDEGISRFNTSPGGHPFDLYDHRRDLGNQGPPDGSRFRGRGFIQLTGRANYEQHGNAVGLGSRLLAEPELANQPEIAARLLASFLGRREIDIKEALAVGAFREARRLVNGGSHGLQRFQDAYQIGARLISAESDIPANS